MGSINMKVVLEHHSVDKKSFQVTNMIKPQFIFIICIAVGVLAKDTEITELMKQFEIVPDVINQGPNHFLKVSYNSGLNVDKGNELTPTQVKNPPKVEWMSKPAAFYTLIMTDPDAPSRTDPKWREFNHWIVVNIPGSSLEQGEVLAQYIGSAPPKDTGLHRYVFLLYEQPQKIMFNEPILNNTSLVGRPNFSVQKFADKYNLGVPLAGNFYQAQYDDWVPTAHKILGF